MSHSLRSRILAVSAQAGHLLRYRLMSGSPNIVILHCTAALHMLKRICSAETAETFIAKKSQTCC
jgi:hypothetical protein